MIYEPHLDKHKEARMIVQNGALVYRKQEYENEGEMFHYKNSKPFDNIVVDTIKIPSTLKEDLIEHLRKKLFDRILLPKLILGQMTVYMTSIGKRSHEDMLIWYKNEIEKANIVGKRHNNY